VWASVNGVSAREYLLAGQQQVDISHRVKMRYLTGLTSKMRLLWRGRTLEIISILEHENRSIHELICQEVQ
jgi:SPP1 family predicted phage head-tail adaptor